MTNVYFDSKIPIYVHIENIKKRHNITNVEHMIIFDELYNEKADG